MVSSSDSLTCPSSFAESLRFANRLFNLADSTIFSTDFSLLLSDLSSNDLVFEIRSSFFFARADIGCDTLLTLLWLSFIFSFGMDKPERVLTWIWPASDATALLSSLTKPERVWLSMLSISSTWMNDFYMRESGTLSEARISRELFCFAAVLRWLLRALGRSLGWFPLVYWSSAILLLRLSSFRSPYASRES